MTHRGAAVHVGDRGQKAPGFHFGPVTTPMLEPQGDDQDREEQDDDQGRNVARPPSKSEPLSDRQDQGAPEDEDNGRRA